MGLLRLAGVPGVVCGAVATPIGGEEEDDNTSQSSPSLATSTDPLALTHLQAPHRSCAPLPNPPNVILNRHLILLLLWACLPDLYLQACSTVLTAEATTLLRSLLLWYGDEALIEVSFASVLGQPPTSLLSNLSQARVCLCVSVVYDSPHSAAP